MMMWYDGNGWGWAGWILMTVGMVAFWALVITAVVLAIRYLTGSRGSAASATSSGQNRPDDVLAERFARGEIDERFARGEIDENEYRQRLSALREHP
jgi:putative membrane protein